MGKYAFLFYQIFKHPEESFSFVAWLISAALEVVIISLIVAAVAKLFDKDVQEWFKNSCIVVGILEILLLIIGLFS